VGMLRGLKQRAERAGAGVKHASSAAGA
jgi:hypothetical protein